MRHATRAIGLRATAIAPAPLAEVLEAEAEAEAEALVGVVDDSVVEDVLRVVDPLFLGFLVEMVLLE